MDTTKYCKRPAESAIEQKRLLQTTARDQHRLLRHQMRLILVTANDQKRLLGPSLTARDQERLLDTCIHHQRPSETNRYYNRVCACDQQSLLIQQHRQVDTASDQHRLLRANESNGYYQRLQATSIDLYDHHRLLVTRSDCQRLAFTARDQIRLMDATSVCKQLHDTTSVGKRPAQTAMILLETSFDSYTDQIRLMGY